jgi:myo-inositol 2-dehydrogenase/D-chiro-inositol 1-dehydrogenase
MAIAEPDAQQRQTANVQAPQAASYSDYQALLDQSDIEAVIIALDNALHADAAIAALEHGKHVYLEKPLATTLADGQRVVSAWRRSGKQAMIGFNYRFNPLYQDLGQHLRANRLGRLLSARSVFTTASRYLPAWKRFRQTGGGVLLDLASHHVDLVRFWFNEPVAEVNATVKSNQSEADTATLELHLPNGLVVQSFFSIGSINEDRFEIYGQAGKLALDRYASWSVEFTNGMVAPLPLRYLRRAVSAVPRSQFAVGKLLAPAREPSFASALAHFVAAVQNGEEISPNFEDGLESLAVIAAAEESAMTGRSVALMKPQRGAAT